ncbi:MAG: hypothetical protein WDN31_01975 [Hyphomicrobium sp.]
MYLAQRGALKSPYDYGVFSEGGAEALRYAPEQPDDPSTDDRWVAEPATFGVGTADDSRAADGGVSVQYGYKPDGSIDLGACDATIAMTGDTLTPSVSGVQINGIDLVRPANVPPTQSTFVGYDQRDEAAADTRGHVGNVLALRKCGPDSGFPPVAGADAFPPVEEAPGDAFPPVEEGGATAPDAGGGEAFPRSMRVVAASPHRMKAAAARRFPRSRRAAAARPPRPTASQLPNRRCPARARSRAAAASTSTSPTTLASLSPRSSSAMS